MHVYITLPWLCIVKVDVEHSLMIDGTWLDKKLLCMVYAMTWKSNIFFCKINKNAY